MKQIATLLILAILFAACATQTTPTGGPKDEAPPVLTRAEPKDGTVNFKEKTIELTFSELIKLQNPKEEIIIIPPVGKKTAFTVKKNKLIITPENGWNDSTTYAINFREAVQDITEGNVVPDLRLAFSTGGYIDSLKIEGTIRDALTEKIPKSITVAIFKPDTFNIFDDAPSYFTKADEEGNFTISNLKPGTYKLYAFDDKNKNLKVESKNEAYAFRASLIELRKNDRKNDLRLTVVDSRPLKLTNTRSQADVTTIRFNKQVNEFKLLAPQKIIALYGVDQSEIISYYPDSPLDSIPVKLLATDSLFQKIDTVVYLKKTPAERIKEPFKVKVSSPEYNTEIGQLKIQYQVNKFIKKIVWDSLHIAIDTLPKIPINKDYLKYDTAKGIITLQFPFKQEKESKKPPMIKSGKSFLISIDNDSSKRDSKSIQKPDLESTGSLLVEVKTKAPNYIVQVLTMSNEVIETAYNNPKPVFKYLKPQNVKLRLIIDSNKNGVWDTSNYFLNTEPEKVYYYQNQEGKFDTPLRANWEVGPLLLISEQLVNKPK